MREVTGGFRSRYFMPSPERLTRRHRRLNITAGEGAPSTALFGQRNLDAGLTGSTAAESA